MPSAYVAPQATVRVADGPRKTFLRGGFGKKFADQQADRDGRQVSVTNPYLEPPKFLFASPQALQCTADGGLVVACRAALDAEARTTAVGNWNVAPDGAVAPLRTRSMAAYGKTSITVCDAPYGKAIRLRASRFAIDIDGGLLTVEHHGVMKTGPDGYVRRLAGSPLLCEGMGSPGTPFTPGAQANDNAVPSGWAQQPGLYRQVIAPYCGSCHSAQAGSLSFASLGNLVQHKAAVQRTVCTDFTMPHSEVAFRRFWSDGGVVSLPGLLSTVLGFPGCPQ